MSSCLIFDHLLFEAPLIIVDEQNHTEKIKSLVILHISFIFKHLFSNFLVTVYFSFNRNKLHKNKLGLSWAKLKSN